ncbi:MAG: DUF4249 family protein [Ignavibacteria bacterium]|nr:DUF4249 family protein [Ignavibacteria bacterium]
MKELRLFPLQSDLIRMVFYALGVGSMACNQPFEPRAPLESKMVVFSILSTDRTDQFVRVERTYMPTGYDAMVYTTDNFVPDAVVTIQESNTTHTLRDTTFGRSDTSRYKFPLRAYFAKPLAINYGVSYQLTVRSPQFEDASTSIVVPARPMVVMTPLSSAVLRSPTSHQDIAEIVFTIDLGAGAKGWIGRLFIYYNVLKEGTWIEDRTEVPFYFTNPKPFTNVAYGDLTHAGYNNRSAAVYLNTHYSKTFVKILYDKYPNSKITFTRAVFELVQVEQHLYNYYMVAHGNNDPYSVRLDEPLYTNLVGGVGVVGAYTLDSLVQAYPENFTYNRD